MRVSVCWGKGKVSHLLLLQHSIAVLQELKLVGDPIVKSVCKHQRSISKSQILAFFSATALKFLLRYCGFVFFCYYSLHEEPQSENVHYTSEKSQHIGVLSLVVIIMYSQMSAHMIHINHKPIYYIPVEYSLTNTVHIKCYLQQIFLLDQHVKAMKSNHFIHTLC